MADAKEKDKVTLKQARPTYSGKMPSETFLHRVARNLHDDLVNDKEGDSKLPKYTAPDASGVRQFVDPSGDATSGQPSYKHGTSYVPKDGPALLHKGETVVSKEKNMAEHTPEEKAHFARSMHKLHGGALHRHFGIAEDKPMPMEKKQEAANSDNPHVAAMGRMAKAMAGWKKK